MLPKLNLSLGDAQTIVEPWFVLTKTQSSLVYAHAIKSKLGLCPQKLKPKLR
jgi:hypothetical protein